MFENEESIYNLIPPQEYKAAKGKRYKSKYPPNIAPTGSTFGNHTTSKMVGNMSGDYNPQGSAHTGKAAQKWGKGLGKEKQLPTEYLRKTDRRVDAKKKPEKFNRQTTYKKEAIPKKSDKPIMGLVSDKNYIVANAVENILAAPKVTENQNPDFLKKKTYGKVPKYLNKIKKEIDDEYQLVQDLHVEEQAQVDQQKFLLPEEER